MTTAPEANGRPPSIDVLARALAREIALPHAVLVDCARQGVADAGKDALEAARRIATEFSRSLIGDVVNASGVLLHTNLGRAPLPHVSTGRPSTLEFDISTGGRGSRHDAVAHLIRVLTGAEDAVVVNNNAAAVMLALAALAAGRSVAVSRGESVEIGGGFRVPEVMEQSGARLIDVGTTNRTNADDYARAISANGADVALLLKVHPSNFTVSGFTESVSVKELAALEVPVVADIGSGLLDNNCPWAHDATDAIPSFLRNEPAARQTLNDGAALVMFSGDKLLGGPQCGIIAGRADLVAACKSHPLMRALRPGGHTIRMLQDALLAFASRSACDEIPFWRMLVTPVDELRRRADVIVGTCRIGVPCATTSLIGAGSVPGSALESFGISVDGDVTGRLRARALPIIARVENGSTIIDLRTVAPDDDNEIAAALHELQ